MEHIGSIIARASEGKDRRRETPAVSAVLPDGALLELLHDSAKELTAFCLYRDGAWERVADFVRADGRRLIPYSPRNNLLAHGVVLFPSFPEEYGSERDLVAAIETHIHRYVDLSPRFERIAAYYVLLTWLYDAFEELPYLRVRGDPGSGKTRFLLAVGSLCYKPIFASGASTVSPLFRILDVMRGTLVIDESDFRFSDERAEVVKVFNNGNVRGFPVLRTETVPGSKEFDPRAYHVFGPKIVATRGAFDDAALESRFLTEEMGERPLRSDIPISLPAAHGEEALRLRNKLLLFRLRHLRKPRDMGATVDRGLEPRLNQILAPLLAIAEDEETRRDLRDLARSAQEDLVADRGLGLEAALLGVLRELWGTGGLAPAVKDVAVRFAERCGAEFPHMTAKRTGWLIRKKLGLPTERMGGAYHLAEGSRTRFEDLCRRYGVDEAAAVVIPG